IFITRTVVPGTGKVIDDTALPLTVSDFELVMDGAPVHRRHEDGSRWLWHPKGFPWLTASFEPGLTENEGYILFSLSYGHNKFMLVWADAFDLALRLARALNARVFEDYLSWEITRENAEELLAPNSKLVVEQGALWKATISGLDSRMQAPLEYAVGPYDAVHDYFVFFLEPSKQVSLVQLVAKLDLCVDTDSLTESHFVLKDPKTDSFLARVLLRPNDQALQIWPFYWMEPFSVVGPATFNLAMQLREELGGNLFLREKPVDDELSRGIQENMRGLGVEFFLWLQG
ncbi:MAG: hypothetical protein K2X81_00675, partial [Candidatus Obscuribacterales bacterium]|nr:hypothetical protein [Candidatus Obscuribacterales bacterium]